MGQVISLGHGIYQIDLVENGVPFRTSIYLIRGEKTVLIESGAAPSNPHILSALEELGIDPAEIDALLVTHIHLDHAGGAGLLMSQCPNATLFAHAKGCPHLVNPEKLIKSARAVYGDLFETYFAPILPIPAERVKVIQDGDEYDLGAGRKLKILESLGHALHHVVFYDPESSGIFTGDSAGVFFHPIQDDHGVKFSMPSTSPTQFDPVSMGKSVQQMIDLAPDRIYYTHFGMTESALDQLHTALELVPFFGEECVAFYQEHRSVEKLELFIQESLAKKLEPQGVPAGAEALKSMNFDINLNAQGIAAYVARLER